MNQKSVEYLTEQFSKKIKELEEIIKDLNEALGAPEAKTRTTITFQSNPAKKIEDTSTLISMDGGINKII
jgi:hypothetical protein